MVRVLPGKLHQAYYRGRRSRDAQVTWPGRSTLWKKRSFDYCYVGGKCGAKKSYEIQTIYAIMKDNLMVTGMARNRNLMIGR